MTRRVAAGVPMDKPNVLRAILLIRHGLLVLQDA
jgi:hypothetical protein